MIDTLSGESAPAVSQSPTSSSVPKTGHESSLADHAFSLGGCELGVGTSATQVEGGNADTNWHRWAKIPGRIADSSTPARTADHWNRVPEDIALLGELGVKHYRMGLEWARLEPKPGEFCDTAFDHYLDELTRLRDAGITPLVTLHHFNNPSWLEQDGAFVNKDAISIFERYVQRVLATIGEFVDDWVTINEPNVYAMKAYLEGGWPPGAHSLSKTRRVMQHLAEAHIRAFRLIHEMYPDARVGFANHLRAFAPARRWHPVHQLSSSFGERLFQTTLTRAMSYGQFSFPFRQPSDIKPGHYYDFQGINYYTRSTVVSLRNGIAKKAPINDLGWEIYPQGLADLVRRISAEYPGPIYITENGTADAADSFRPLYLYEHLKAALTSGAPVERFYHWCFTDNWEWSEGEEPRFGLVALNYETQTREIRESGRFYADIIANDGVTEDAYTRWVAGRSYPMS